MNRKVSEIGMKEVIIKYKSNKTLAALKDLGKYLGFSVSEQVVSSKSENSYINGVTLIPGDESIDVTELQEVFTGKGLVVTQLRNAGWKREK